MGVFWVLLWSIEPRHLTNLAHARAPWATGFYLIVEYYIHNITINFHVDDDVMGKKHALSEGRPRTINLLRWATPFVYIGRGLLAPILVRSHFS
jgi:hypothetical protein